jgi:hypothetical protein
MRIDPRKHFGLVEVCKKQPVANASSFEQQASKRRRRPQASMALLERLVNATPSQVEHTFDGAVIGARPTTVALAECISPGEDFGDVEDGSYHEGGLSQGIRRLQLKIETVFLSINRAEAAVYWGKPASISGLMLLERLGDSGAQSGDGNDTDHHNQGQHQGVLDRGRTVVAPQKATRQGKEGVHESSIRQEGVEECKAREAAGKCVR